MAPTSCITPRRQLSPYPLLSTHACLPCSSRRRWRTVIAGHSLACSLSRMPWWSSVEPSRQYDPFTKSPMSRKHPSIHRTAQDCSTSCSAQATEWELIGERTRMLIAGHHAPQPLRRAARLMLPRLPCSLGCVLFSPPTRPASVVRLCFAAEPSLSGSGLPGGGYSAEPTRRPPPAV